MKKHNPPSFHNPNPIFYSLHYYSLSVRPHQKINIFIGRFSSWRKWMASTLSGSGEDRSVRHLCELGWLEVGSSHLLLRPVPAIDWPFGLKRWRRGADRSGLSTLVEKRFV
ncbi:hypothetical protein CDAR_316901 [Caerostris darwini]|uniref:Ycf15 n=1 Tax=Caerostris darwini TaxID=1538125 RepID=A0AAV4Q0A8_9ARAC|nr:hypothetical protein CDAR_316901 [Caerostris darwini]